MRTCRLYNRSNIYISRCMITCFNSDDLHSAYIHHHTLVSHYQTNSMQVKNTIIKDGHSLKIKQKYIFVCTSQPQCTYASIPLWKLYDNFHHKHVPKSSKIIVNQLVLKDDIVLANNLKVGNPRLYCFFFFQAQHSSFLSSMYYNIC